MEPALKTMKTASRTWKSGREADGKPGRGRPAREAPEKRKTSENTNIFCNLTSSWEVRLPSRALANGEWEEGIYKNIPNAARGHGDQLGAANPLQFYVPGTSPLIQEQLQRRCPIR